MKMRSKTPMLLLLLPVGMFSILPACSGDYESPTGETTEWEFPDDPTEEEKRTLYGTLERELSLNKRFLERAKQDGNESMQKLCADNIENICEAKDDLGLDPDIRKREIGPTNG